jgi:hypothetical protein
MQTAIGLDIAKNVFQVHGIDANEKVVVRRQLRHSQVMAFFEALSPCLIGMEACATVHLGRVSVSHGWPTSVRKPGLAGDPCSVQELPCSGKSIPC